MSTETADETLLDRLGRPSIPLDLLAVVSYVAIVVVVLFQPGIYGTPIAVALGLPLLFFLPGYALVSALFPGVTPDDVGSQRRDVGGEKRNVSSEQRNVGGQQSLDAMTENGLSGVERAALGFGVSVALLPLVGIALAASPWSIDPWPVVAAVGGLAVVSSVVGTIRRFRRPPDRRFSVPARAWLGRGRRSLSGDSTAESALNVGLVVAVVLSVAAIGFAVAAPGPSQSYTTVSLLTQNETGQLVAEDYPRNFRSGEGKPIVVELTNHEGERQRYSVVVELQRVRKGDSGGAKVVQDRRLATFTPTVGAGQTWQTTHEVTPTMTGENLRLVYLVYEGEPPQNPSASNAYRRVHVWVNVTA